MAKNGTYSPDIIATLRAALDAAAPPLLTKQEVVRELRNTVRAARGRGCPDQQILDIFAARILLEITSITAVLMMLTIALWALDLTVLPEDVLQVIGGWALLAWLAAALGMTVGGLAEKADVVARFWPPLSYILMAVSGVAFTVNALPPAAQEVILWVPMINAVEYLREGWFGSVMHAHYDIGYLATVNVVLSMVGFSLVRQIGTGNATGEE